MKRGIYAKYIKRAMDFTLSLLALIVLSPILIAVLILVKSNLGSPVFFKQKRPGKGGKIIELLKFRTMTEARGKDGELLPDSERNTPFGEKLRSTSIDELPQLVNILKGDMSIVGPRPLLTEYLPYYTEDEGRRHDVRPGLTGLAQVSGRNYLEWNDRLSKDVEYISNITFKGDMSIILKTAFKVVKREDVAITGKVEKKLSEVREIEKHLQQ